VGLTASPSRLKPFLNLPPASCSDWAGYFWFVGEYVTVLNQSKTGNE
jgi:hypothetical protein